VRIDIVLSRILNNIHSSGYVGEGLRSLHEGFILPQPSSGSGLRIFENEAHIEIRNSP